MLPVALEPAFSIPNPVNLTMFAPPTPTRMFPPDVKHVTLLVPLAILVVLTLLPLI